jgi:hypothetical protein
MIDPEANMTRLHELLADRATQRLSDGERHELLGLLGPDARDDSSFDWAAAALDLPYVPAEVEPLPARLRARVEADAVEWLARSTGVSMTGSGPADRHVEPGSPDISSRVTAFTWLPWLAAAACLALALIAWWPSRAPDLTALRSALGAEPDTSVLAWNDVALAGVTGDVMWNNRAQQGYLRLRGLAVNDPTAMQYQLWIFDKARGKYSTNTAVDGGVFDVDTATGDVIVPIDAKLEIFEPTLFAVTTEPPGGVVVHEDDEARGYAIVLTASPVS